MYTKKIASNGRTMYFKDGKMVSRKDIPEDEVWRLEGLDSGQVKQMLSSSLTLDELTSRSPLLKQGPVCIFCEEAATTSKYINGQTIQLCQKDYYAKTTGEISAEAKRDDKSQRKNSIS